MRRLLFTAAAAGPLLLIAAAPAMAATSITGSTTTPVTTSTVNNGQPDDATLATGATITVTTPVAVTVDSNNVFTNSGTITITGVDNSTGVLVLGGHTASFVNSAGTINIGESYTPTDTNNDGVPDGAFAQGTGRYGVRVTGPGALVGPINLASGSITVQGKNSFGVSIEAPLTGDVTQASSIGVTGENSTGLSISGPVTGKVLVTAGVGTVGTGTQAIDLTGDISGRFSLYAGAQSTGYRVTTRSSDPTINAGFVTAGDITQSLSAVRVASNVGGGVFIGAPPSTTVATDTTTDADGDGIVDSVEGTGSITTYGSAPSFLIGATDRDIHLGVVGTGNNAYGLIIEGSILGNGVFDGNGGNALQIGAGGHAVQIDGGAHIIGTVTADGFEADATSTHILAGAQVPKIANDGSILASVTSAKASASTSLLIDAGANVPTLNNTGTISSGLTGDLGSSYAIVDKSGSLTTITNDRFILTNIVPAASGDVTQGKTVAIDVSANTTGVSLIQTANPASTTAVPIVPSIVGDILLGSGNDTVQFQTGTGRGALSFGAGHDSLLLDGGATYSGALTSSGSVDINVANGALSDTSATTVQSGSLNVGAASQLTLSADPVNNKATYLNVSGPATIAAGGQLGLNLLSLPNGPTSYTVISSSALTVGTPDSSLTGTTPYLFVAAFHADPAAGIVSLDVRRRTAEEAGMNRSETAGYDPIYNNLNVDAGVQHAFLAQTNQTGLNSAVDQMLPDHAGDVFRALSWAAEAQGVATGQGPLGQEQAGSTRAWTQEIVLHEQKDQGLTSGYDLFGIGVVTGLESVSAKGDALGARIGFTTANIRNPNVPSDNLLGVSEFDAGVYWRGAFGPLKADAQLGAGYVYAYNRREFLFSDIAGVVHRVAGANWNGYTMSARLGLQYTANVGSFFIQPRVHLDYFRSHEGGYTETGGGDGFDLSVNSRSGDQFAVSGTVVAGTTWGSSWKWRPQIEVGYRGVVSGTAGDTTASFSGASDTMVLASESIRKGALLGRVGLEVYSSYLDVLLDAGTEYNETYTDIDVHLTARTVF